MHGSTTVRRLIVCGGVFWVLHGGCALPSPILRTSSTEDPRPAPKATKVAPRAFESVRDLLEQTAALVEGEVFEVGYSFDDCAGPRTRVHLREATSLLGTTVPPELELKVFGGPLPNGLWAEASGAPRFALGSRYVVFLRNTDWTFAPVLGSHAYRREVIAGKPVLITQEGHAVTGFTEHGIAMATVQLTEAVGRRHRGMERAVATPPPDRGVADSGPSGAGLEAKDDTSSVGGPVVGSGGGAAIAGLVGSDARQIAASGRHARPASLGVSGDAVVSAISLDQFVASIRHVAERENVRIGGPIELEPRWRCWNMTPESNLGGLR